MTKKKKLHYWFSKKQQRVQKTAARYGEQRRDTYALINGKEVLYTEATTKKKPTGKWDDYEYLGEGEWSRSE